MDRIVLAAHIVVGEDGAFSVEIDDTVAAFREEEAFRFTLHFYARVLFELERTQRSVRHLPYWMSLVAQTALDRDADLFVIAGVEGSLVRSVASPVAEGFVRMHASGVRNRIVVGSLASLCGNTLARSVIAVCQAVLPRLSPPMREAVPAALANMNASYEMTHRYADPNSQQEVPALAYFAASFV